MDTNQITIDTGINLEDFNVVAQGHIAECILGGRNTVNVAEMLKAGDFEPLEEAMDELTEAFGSKSEKGSPRAKLYSRVAEYAKTDKKRTPYTFKKTDSGYKIVIKVAKVMDKKKASQTTTAYFTKIVDMAERAELTKKECDGLVKEFKAMLAARLAEQSAAKLAANVA